MVDVNEDTQITGGAYEVRSVDDLPEPVDGYHEIDDKILITEPIQSEAGLEITAPAPILGLHGGASLFTHLGDQPTIKARDQPVFMDALTVINAGGGQLHDISAPTGVEHLATECSFVGGDLGRIDGYRVPSWKTCNFEQFTGGFSFSGESNKVLFSGCPFRNVTADGVTIFELSQGFAVEEFKVTGCYFKDLVSDGTNADTKVLQVDSMPSGILKWTDNDHIGGVTQSQIFNGVTPEDVGVIVDNSFPLQGSGVSGDLSLDATTTVTGSGSGPTRITGATTLAANERTSNPSNGVLRYVGKSDETLRINFSTSVSGDNTTFEVSLAKNGTLLSRTSVQESTSSTSKPAQAGSVAKVDVDQNDEVSVFLENVGGTADLNAESLGVVA